MAVNPDQLWTTLDKIEQKLLSIVDDFDAVSQAAVALNGDIAKVLPVQLNASADAVLDLVNGAGQNSIKNLKDYVDNIPLGDLRTKSSAEAIRNGQKAAPTAGNAPTAPAVDLTPRTSAPQSAIAQESVDLEKYKKNKIEENKTEEPKKKLNENNEFSFDAILDEEGIDGEGYNSEIPEADTDYLDDDYAEGFNDDFEEDDAFDFDKMEDERINNENPTPEEIFSFNDELFDDAI